MVDLHGAAAFATWVQSAAPYERLGGGAVDAAQAGRAKITGTSCRPRAAPPRQPSPRVAGAPARRRRLRRRVECANARFDLATCLAFYRLDPEKADGGIARAGGGGSRRFDGGAWDRAARRHRARRQSENLAEGHRWIATAATEHAHPQAWAPSDAFTLGGHPALAEDEAAALALRGCGGRRTPDLVHEATGTGAVRGGSGSSSTEARAVRLLPPRCAAPNGAAAGAPAPRRRRAAAARRAVVGRARARHAERLPVATADAPTAEVYRGDGTAATLGELLDAAARSDVVVLGEVHDDPWATRSRRTSSRSWRRGGRWRSRSRCSMQTFSPSSTTTAAGW